MISKVQVIVTYTQVDLSQVNYLNDLQLELTENKRLETRSLD